MKTMKSILFSIACLCLLVTCSKDEPAIMQGNRLLNDDVLTSGKVFKVQPTKGTDITADLKQAFDDAIAAGHGSVVQLPEGEFDLGIIEIRDFYGSFIGAGKGKTVITSKTELDPGIFVDEGSNWLLIKFIGGDVKLSGMTIQTPAGTLIDEENTLMGLLLFSDFGPQYESETGQINAVVDNVDFIGQPLGDGRYNAPYAILATNDYNFWIGYSGMHRSNINLTVTNCSFDTFYEGTFTFGAKGKLTIGTKNNGNIFNNIVYQIDFEEFINSEITVISNTLKNIIGIGIYLENYPYGGFDDELSDRSTLCKFENNQLNIGYLGMLLHDHRIVSYPQEKLPILMQVKNNNFILQAEGSYGVEMIEGVNAVIRNNKFSGKGAVGFLAGAYNGMGVWSENCLFLGNNFSTGSFSDVALWLDTYTKNFTVVGGNNKDQVRNDGEDNIITGMKVNKSLVPLGQTIVDNFHLMKEEMKNKH